MSISHSCELLERIRLDIGCAAVKARTEAVLNHADEPVYAERATQPRQLEHTNSLSLVQSGERRSAVAGPVPYARKSFDRRTRD
eukprot:2205821-Prymnesium_polylepis.1